MADIMPPAQVERLRRFYGDPVLGIRTTALSPDVGRLCQSHEALREQVAYWQGIARKSGESRLAAAYDRREWPAEEQPATDMEEL